MATPTEDKQEHWVDSLRGDAGVFASLKHRLGFRDSQHNLMGLLFVLPNVIVFSIFLLGPVLYAFFISFQEWNILKGAGEMAYLATTPWYLEWIPFRLPLANYAEVLTPLPVTIESGSIVWNNSVLQDPTANLWWFALKNTFVYAIGTVPLQILGGLAVALLLDTRVRFKKTYRAAYFMPVMLSGAASAVMWRWFLSADGIINSLLPTGLEHNWAGNPSLALGGVMLMAIWGGIGVNMIFFLAGLQNIPEELYEAARIDGASKWHRFRHVTWPNLGNTNFFVIVMAVISAFQVFGIAMVFSQGGPYYATTTTVLLIYQRAFEEGKMGLGAAMAFLLFILIFVFSYYQYRYQQSGEVSY